MDKANARDNCYKGNTRGQPRMKYRRGQRKIDEPVIQFEGGVNEIQHIQRSMIEIAEEQA